MSINKNQKLTFVLPDFENELKIPFVPNRVSAGFLSPAKAFMESNIDLNAALSENNLATFYITINENSMIDVGINDKDI